MATNDKNNIDNENYNPDDMEKILSEAKADAYTNILSNLKFENKLDEMIFNLLPLSKKQKEELVMACAVSDDIKEHYENIKKIKEEMKKKVDTDIVNAITGLEQDEWQKRLSPACISPTSSANDKDDKSFFNMMDSIIDDLPDEE